MAKEEVVHMENFYSQGKTQGLEKQPKKACFNHNFFKKLLCTFKVIYSIQKRINNSLVYLVSFENNQKVTKTGKN